MTAATKTGKHRALIRRRPGRPSGTDHAHEVRTALLTASRKLFAERDFKSVSVRDIARAARVNEAMVHYHFKNKQGLYRAMLQETIGPIVRQIQAVIADPPANSESSLPPLMRAMMTMFARDPWVPRLIVREVLGHEGPFREMFIRDFASQGGGRLPTLLTLEIGQGRIRSDLDVTLGALSVLALCIFPFIALPVAERVLNFEMTDELVERLIEHTQRLFYKGAS
ncbi:MAG: TetR/AcrR family transcriptional regulator [Gammaproteobacteria bacterium]|nr:TetR/AcrR family transcriptional regulator [Gammaproteobacteria bacterium]